MSTQLSCAIVGLPNVGKSTLFNALTKSAIPSENYPFCTIDPNVGVVPILDPRVVQLAHLSHSQKTVFADVRFVDIAGLVKGASTGAGLGNQFLSHIQDTDAIIQVVRCFEDDNIVHVSGKVDPIDDIEVIEMELILSDLTRAHHWIERLTKQAKGKKELLAPLKTLEKAVQHLDQNLPLRILTLSDEERAHLAPYPFLSLKPVLYLCNIAEEDLACPDEILHVQRVQKWALQRQSEVLTLSARFEEELSQLDEEEALEFLRTVGLEESGLQRLCRKAFSMLGLITFITTGDMETKAWTIKRGTKAPQAAGKIHSDLEMGFISAEVIPAETMITLGREEAKGKGLAPTKGKEYLVQDGDVILFYHHR
jgi:hypothetical protein